MRWLRTTRRVDLGKYEAPPEAAPVPIESIVADGVLISEAVVRMTLRNHVVVDALRERRDVDRTRLRALAAAEYDAFADHEWESAERLRMRRSMIRLDDPLQEYGLTNPERRESERREQVHRALSDAYADRTYDDAALDALVARAIAQAWLEVAPVLATRARSTVVVEDADYARKRGERTAALMADLEALAAERGIGSGSPPLGPS
jgi:hypothetical protein